jgi:magnesium transporter
MTTAAPHATTSVPLAGPDDRAVDVRAALDGGDHATVEDVVVCERGRPVGVVARRALIASRPETAMRELMVAPVAIPAGADPASAAHAPLGPSQSGLVLVDGDGRFAGVIPAGERIALLQEEHEEDMARIGGYLKSGEQARSAAVEPLGRRLWHRLPWLLIGLAGAMTSALLVGAFERRLEETVLLAFFVPAVVYMADAVGTQTETVLIRALPMGLRLRAMLWRELLTGLIMGLVVGAGFFVFATVAWGDEEVALAVGLALIGSCTIATGVAMALPAAFERVGRDPAFGSGPLATVIQDLLSIVVYFGIVIVVLG